MLIPESASCSSCLGCYTPPRQKVCLVVALTAAIVSSIFLTMGAAGLFSTTGNFAALSAGGAGLVSSIATGVIIFCIKSRTNVASSPREEPLPVNDLLLQVQTETIEEVGRNLLFSTILFKNLEAFKEAVDRLLQQKVALTTYKDSHKYNIFHMVACNGTLEMLQYLETKNVKYVDENLYNPSHEDPFNEMKLHNGTALHLAVYGNHASFIPLLVKLGADINAQDNLGQTPLHLAVNGKFACVKALVEANAKLTVRSNPLTQIESQRGGNTPFEWIIDRRNTAQNIEIAEYLVTKEPKYARELQKFKQKKYPARRR